MRKFEKILVPIDFSEEIRQSSTACSSVGKGD